MMNSLTPVQAVNGLLMKRDDLYAPFGAGNINGGKLRQCMMLVDSIHNDHDGIITYCSIHSPQAPITAAAAHAHGLPCKVLYGATNANSLKRLPMPRLAMLFGARLVICSRIGRHSVLHVKAKEMAEEENSFIVQYGINLASHGQILLDAVAAQVQNIPDELENLVITCGSGITSSGVLIGLHQYSKRVKNVHLVATAPDRRAFIHSLLRQYGADRAFQYHDLFHTPGFSYEKPERASWGGVTLHPHYEAKTMRWFRNSGLNPQETLFWIVGAEPVYK